MWLGGEEMREPVRRILCCPVLFPFSEPQGISVSVLQKYGCLSPDTNSRCARDNFPLALEIICNRESHGRVWAQDFSTDAGYSAADFISRNRLCRAPNLVFLFRVQALRKVGSVFVPCIPCVGSTHVSAGLDYRGGRDWITHLVRQREEDPLGGYSRTVLQHPEQTILRAGQ